MKEQVVVVGLGRFGSSVAREIHSLGHEVLATDVSEAAVNEIAPDVTHAVQVDASVDGALEAIGAGDVATAIVARALVITVRSAVRTPPTTVRWPSSDSSLRSPE